MASGATLSWVKTPFDTRRFHDLSNLSFRCRNPFGSIQPWWLQTDQDSSLIKVRVAADYSDSMPDSKYTRDRGYHPLEEVKERPKKKDLLLTDIETARTVVEANSKGLLVFPARVHNEPHGHVSWSEFQYVVDEYGGNILMHRGKCTIEPSQCSSCAANLLVTYVQTFSLKYLTVRTSWKMILQTIL
ncbi:Pentatricopeptide repeat (PPR) superfamily protein [Zea mays]|nr:Pentatricopeptide repeat (PPR) superfamily protein [Zea mays]